MKICGGCNSEIGHGQDLQAMGVLWHPECFRCHRCEKPISDLEFSVADNRSFHKNCYKELYHPRCDVCKRFPLDAKYLILNDDRKLCSECSNSAIMNTDECQPLYLEVQRFFKGLNMEVDEQIPLLLVDAQELNEAKEGEKSGHHYLSHTGGLCLSEEQSVSEILRQPRFGNFRIIDMFTEPYRLMRRCEVTAFLISYGLPRLFTGSILVHEMMHAWLRLNGYFNLSADVEEGMCEVLAHMWPNSELKAPILFSSSSSHSCCMSMEDYSAPMTVENSSSPSSKTDIWDVETPDWHLKESESKKKLDDFFIQLIESHTAYGEGFKEGKKAVDKYGLKSTLDHIRLTGCFP